MPAYVLDTSAILAVLNGEPDEEMVLNILEQARKEQEPDFVVVYIPFMALMEAEYLMRRRHAEVDVRGYMTMVHNWPVREVESNPDWRHQAAAIKATGRLSVADAWIAGLALSLSASLVHKDPEFDRLDGLQVVRLLS